MLDSVAAPDSDMAHIPGGTFGVFLVGHGREPSADAAATT